MILIIITPNANIFLMTKLPISANGIADTKNHNFVIPYNIQFNLHLRFKKWLIPYLRKATI